MTLRPWHRRLFWSLAGLALLALLAWALRPAPVPVSVARVATGPFVDSVIEEGRTRLRDTWNVSVPVAGYLQRVALEVGDEVEQGQALFRLEPSPAPALDPRARQQAEDTLQAAEARLRAARANLETSRAEGRFAESEYERYRQLHQRNLVSTTELEQHRSQRDRLRALESAAAAGVEAARFEVESARAVLAVASGQRDALEHPALTIRAPIAGTVLTRYRCCEGSVAAGEPILELGSLQALEVQVDLLSMDAVRVRPGMAVHLTGWGGDEVLAGRVRRIEPSGFTRVSALGVDEQRVPVIIDFEEGQEPAALGLGSGFRVDAEFLVWQADEVAQLPTSALFRAEGQWAVFRVEEGRAVRVPVTPGRRSGLVSELVDGLAAGDMIITHPGERVADGVRVRIED
ncbi:efflux RND transporter periplasmic adaptor subunit [uncultured Halomonas sp.]|uniref:efflux RND transporter periplasmic adaptor subunit n=1 Tax=Halomonas mongoliensis TaxID=321265 RepID=UPI0026045FF2|nr:HlyD family efflux transporter periplasmic adaptor subunit [uncultured Halomonas sp.]